MAPTAEAEPTAAVEPTVTGAKQPDDERAARTAQAEPQRQPGETDEDFHKRDVKAKGEARRAGLGETLVRETLKAPADPKAWRARGMRLAIQMRPYVRGEDLQGIYLEGIHDPTDIGMVGPSVKDQFVRDPKNAKSWTLHEDLKEGYIARSETDVQDQWYLSKAFVERYFYPAYDTMGRDPTKDEKGNEKP